MSDQAPATHELLDQARAGDAQALQALLQRYREYVRLLVRCRAAGRLQARVDGSDLVQETLLRAAQNIQQFRGASEEEWCAWLARIAEREVIHQVRHHLGAAKRAASREQSLPALPDDSGNGASRLERWVAKSQTSPSLAAMRKERAILLAEALARLPADHREVLILRHLEGLDFAEVALRMNRSSGAVRVLWTRALKKLREELQAGPQLDSGCTHA
ncbi:MAG TPA: sigma-70 family RNA polymerase sigma factor [Gemmataceae bacterium]|nr:sigma-70 family RNA polymerase sigma factor [Gemmataceae bacterium]